MALQDSNVKDLQTLYADVEKFGIRESEDCNMDSVVLRGDKFKQPDGSIKVELSVGVTEADFKHAGVPVVDVVKFALRHCPELIYQALRETGTTNDVRRIASEVDHDFDMESGS